MMRACAGGLAVVAIAATVRISAADGLDADRFEPASPMTGLLALDTARLPERGRFAFGAGLVFSRDLLVGRDREGAEVMDVVGNRFALGLVGDYGLHERVQLGLMLPVVLVQDGDATNVQPGALSGQALGDLRLRAKIGIASGGGKAVAGVLNIQIPTGNETSFAGAQSFELEPALLASASSGILTAALRVGYRLRERTEIAELVVDDELALAGGVAIAIAKRVSLIGELGAGLGLEGGERARPVEILAGARVGNGSGWSLRPAIGFGLTHGYGAPSVRGLAVASYELGAAKPAPPPDLDGDGIVGEADRCPLAPEDRDAFEDDDGCPDIDNDGDGITDGNDRCPLVAGLRENQGCPDVDTDGDGMVDRLDPCPAEPEDVDSFQDEDGCPDLDNDGDGIPDTNDRCPREPEDIDGFQDVDGCPEPDNDNDGIPDLADACPNEPETFNGVDDDDGCPDQGKVLAVLTPEKIEITEQVQFATAKFKIAKPSYKLLATVAKILILHPNIKKIRVEGHTDSRGSAAKNQKLSQSRADSVKRHLVEVNGIDPSRLEAVGFGPDRPIEDNATAKGRAANRRVEFVITEKE